MNESSVLTFPAISQWVAECRDIKAQLVEAEAHIVAHEKLATESREQAQARRFELGRYLIKVRDSLPRRGARGEGWTAFLEAIEVDDSTAHRYMELARGGLATSHESQLRSSEGPAPDPDAPPPSDTDAPPSEGSPVIEIVEPIIVAPPNRDGWCTPDLIAAALPHVDVDPCSNPFSVIRADTSYSLEAGHDGLALPWFGLVYVNGPFSKLLPWAERLASELHHKRSSRTVKGAGFMVNADSSTGWWKVLTKHLPLRLDFDDRIEFKPPPGVEPSKNDRAQSLLMDEAFWKKCNRKALLAMGTLWERRSG